MNIINDPYTFNTVLNYALYAAVVFVFIMIGICVVAAIIQNRKEKAEQREFIERWKAERTIFPISK